MVGGMSAGDTAWVLASTALVLLMVPGLALFYGGLVRSRAVLNTLAMSVAALAVVGVQWVLAGYALAFGPGTVVGSLSWAGLAGIGTGAGPYSAAIPHLAFIAFQAMFAGITVALISGAVVERVRFHAFIAFGVLWTTFVYDPLAHWVWASDGWLHRLGALDFAGGTVVHISAGVAAFVAAIVVGRRSTIHAEEPKPHNVAMTLTGAGLLWVGWLGFNGGSSLAADGVAALAVVNTFAAGSAALLVWSGIDSARRGRTSVVGAATGVVAGLVAITPAAGYVTPLAALAIGAAGAGASYAAMRRRCRIAVDDALDVFACHGVAGIVGALLTGVFATKAVNPAGADGLLYGNAQLFGVQALAVASTVAFTAPLTAIILLALRAVASLRVTLAREISGVDASEHGEIAYVAGGALVLAADMAEVSAPMLMPSAASLEASEAA